MSIASHPVSAGDPVAAFLERHGLSDVLARHLEHRIEQVDDDEREAILLQLADIYTKLLEAEVNPVERAALEQRSRRLLELAPSDSADELRLALLRNTYRAAERIAENHRLRVADENDVEKARQQFAEVVPELHQLSQQLDRATSILERRLSRAGRSEGAALEDRLMQQRRILMQSRYMHAWSLYYKAFLSTNRRNAEDLARQAQRIFAELLMTESAHPRPDEVSIDLRSIEPLARSIVGMALCQSITSSWATATAWIDLLTHENAAPEVKPLIDGWRILIFLEHNEYREARLVLTAAIEAERQIPISWLRLAAIGALEADGANREANSLARFALTQLASRGELQQVLDLAERYGTSALGETGFAMRYIEGLVTYRLARDLHETDDPATDGELVELYQSARRSFEQSLREPDVADYPDAVESVHMLIAWSLFYSNDLLAAADRFQSIAETDEGERAEEALWMAIVCLDRLLAQRDSGDLRSRHSALTERFLNAFPGSRHAPTLVVNRSLHVEELSGDEIERLLAIPPDHEAYTTARRRAVLALYRDFRRAADRNRPDRAYRFLSVAIPLLEHPGGFGSDGEPERIHRQVTLIRQILEVALHADVGRAAEANIAIDSYASLDDGRDDVRQYRDEVRFRQVQLAILQGDPAEAFKLADALWVDPRSRWAQLAARAMFQHANRLWHTAAVDSEQYSHAISMVVRYGGRVLREFEDEDDPLGAAGAASVARAVADASMDMWQRTDDEEHGRIALFLSQRLLERQPNHRGLLWNVAVLAEAFADPAQSLDAWRRLVAGSDRGSREWFEARYHQIRLLAANDPSRALLLMHQHRQFYPEYGPDPWGDRFRDLAARIDAAANGND
jgi:hypothetical protein